LTSPSGSSASLYWLPSIDDWAGRIGAIARMEAGEAAWSALVALAGVQLDFVRIGRLDKALLRLFGDGPPVTLATRPIRLAVLASSTTAQLSSALRVAGLRRGLWITLYEPDYGQYRQELANPASGLHGFAPTAVLLALDSGHLVGDVDPAIDRANAEAVVRQRSDLLQISGVRRAKLSAPKSSSRRCSRSFRCFWARMSRICRDLALQSLLK
jgi:hypothetical protein